MNLAEAAVRPGAFWEDLRYGADGLVPVVVQSVEDGRVLMLAYADREAVRRTATERRAWFWSRSRRELWRKGDTSGHALDVAAVRWDCDADALLYVVTAHGPACHTGEASCFYRGEVGAPVGGWATPTASPAAGGTLGAALDGLAGIVAARRKDMPAGSYVASLLAAGAPRALQKVGEEAVEAVIAGMALGGQGDGAARASAAAEFADLVFHALVALAALGIAPEAVAAELAARHGRRPARPAGA